MIGQREYIQSNYKIQMGEERHLIYGFHAVKSLLQGNTPILKLCVQERRNDRRLRELLQLAQQRQIRTDRVSSSQLAELGGGVVHQGVIAVALKQLQPLQLQLSELLHRPSLLLLILDRVEDPRNLGACLRSADAVGADAVMIPRDHSAQTTGVASKVASGAAESVPVLRVANLARSLQQLQRSAVQIVGLAADAGHSFYDIDLTGPTALVLGGEGRGLRRLTRSGCDRLAALPMQGAVASLNVSVAAGICMFEVCRQRLALV